MKTFQKEIERLQENEILKLSQFWECEPSSDAIFHAINKNLFIKLSSLSEAENKIIYTLLSTKEENLTERQLMRLSGLETDAFSSAIKNLSNNMLIYIRKSIAKLAAGNNKIYIFNFIKEIVGNINITNDLSMMETKINQGFLYLEYKNHQLFQLLFESNGILEAHSVSALQNNLDKYYKSGQAGLALYFDGKKLKPVYHLIQDLIVYSTPSPKIFLGRGLSFLSTFGNVFAFLSTRRALMNKSGELCKYDQDLMDILFGDKELAAFFIRLFIDMNILLSEGKTLCVLSGYKTFLHQDINTTYKSLLETNPPLERFCKSFLKTGWEFSIEDVNRYACIHGKSKKDVAWLLNLCFFIGLVNKSEEDTYIPSLLFEGMINEAFYIRSDEPSFIVNANFSLVADTSKISIYDDFLFRTFFNLESDGKVRLFKIEKKSFLKAIYLGYQPEELFDVLRTKSSKPVPEMIFTILDDWYKSYKSVKLKRITVFEGDKDVIDMIFYNRSLEKYIVKRHGNELLELYPEIENIRYIEDDDIFIIPED